MDFLVDPDRWNSDRRKRGRGKRSRRARRVRDQYAGLAAVAGVGIPTALFMGAGLSGDPDKSIGDLYRGFSMLFGGKGKRRGGGRAKPGHDKPSNY